MEKISWLDKVTNGEVPRTVKEDGKILNAIWQKKHRNQQTCLKDPAAHK